MTEEITCNKCLKRPAQVRLEYGPSDYCAICFCELFEKRVARANREFGLLRRGDVIGVGVSGGKDSAAVLYVLSKMTKRIGAIKLVPICIDEGIKGYRDKAIVKAEELCSKLGLKLHVFTYKELIMKRAVLDRTMPPGNITGMTDLERAELDSWINDGAPL